MLEYLNQHANNYWINKYGKTTLFNRITNTRYDGESTKTVDLRSSAYGQTKNYILDSPGLDAKGNKIQLAAIILTAVSEHSVNRIIVTVKLERYQMMLNYFGNIIKNIKPFNHLITVVVTHWDLLEQSQKKEHEIYLRQAFQKLNFLSVIFTSKEESGWDTYRKILDEINSTKACITAQMEPQILQLFMDDDFECELSDKEENLSGISKKNNYQTKKV